MTDFVIELLQFLSSKFPIPSGAVDMWIFQSLEVVSITILNCFYIAFKKLGFHLDYFSPIVYLFSIYLRLSVFPRGAFREFRLEFLQSNFQGLVFNHIWFVLACLVKTYNYSCTGKTYAPCLALYVFFCCSGAQLRKFRTIVIGRLNIFVNEYKPFYCKYYQKSCQIDPRVLAKVETCVI